MSATLTQLRTYLEEITHTANDATFPNSTYELQLLNLAYEKTAYKYDWPETIKRFADVVVAYVDRYSLQSDFRKFAFLRQQGIPLTKTQLEFLEGSFNKYVVQRDSGEYIMANQPTTASTPFTMSGSYSAGSAVVVTLDTVTGISPGDEVFISDTTSSEFTKVQAVDTTLLTITIKLANSHNGKVLYRVPELNYFAYQKTVTALASGSDTPVLPGDTHFIMAHYAAYLYYKDIEEPDRAQMHKDIWTEGIDEAWLAFDKLATGESGELTV